MTAQVRPAAVAGLFYPEDPAALASVVDAHLAAAAPASPGPVPKALVVPHAGYVYSGPVAATGYALLAGRAVEVSRVVLLGPAHRFPVRGLAVSGADAFDTPLGRVTVDDRARRTATGLSQVVVEDRAHAAEHSLEVHLPFLQRVLDAPFGIVPLAVGDASADEVAEVLDVLWGGPETLIVVSSDLSHYHDHATATARDARTAAAVVSGDVSRIGTTDACGAAAVNGLLVSARRHGLRAVVVDVRNSGDTAGGRDRVVGYGAFAFVPVDAGGHP